MTTLQLDTRGRLVLLERVPPQVASGKEEPAPAPDWPALFREAGLDMGSFVPTEPAWVPPFHADTRKAWEGKVPELPAASMRVEAASFRGKPVYFQVVGPWTRPLRMQPLQQAQGARWATNVAVVLVILVLGAGDLAARHNIKLGRGDRRGALRFSMATFLGFLACWALTADHATSILAEYGMFQKAVGLGMFIGGGLWIAYMALEPFIRRLWPSILVGWSRLLAGRWRDPRVGRDLLFGAAAGVAVCLLISLDWIVPVLLGRTSPRPAAVSMDMLLGGARFAGASLFLLIISLLNTMSIVAFIFVVMFLVRRKWLAAVLVWILMTALNVAAAGTDLPALSAAVYGMSFAILLGLLFRFGVLALAVAGVFMLQGFPLSLNLSAWYGNYSLMSALILAAPAVYGYLVSRGRGPAPAAGAPRAAG
jgi:serine/threonine-protein kinase